MRQVHYIYDLNDKISFGKHNGKTIWEILNNDASYLYWCIDNLSTFALSHAAFEAAKTQFPYFAELESINMERISGGTSQKHRLERAQEWEEENNRRNSHYEEDDYYYPEHYDEYAGSYAQDVEWLSDEFIDDVFDGNPDAYWNID